MKEAFEGIKVGIIGATGFVTQMTNLDMVFKAIIGLLTVIYLGGKVVKMFRDWRQSDKDK